MKILHTSDWHIGRTLYGKKRYMEFEAFSNWLIDTIEQENVDVLLISGDIFDTSTPGNASQELYYRFLSRVAFSECRYIVIIAGNHDSASFLNAPSQLLKALKVYVVAQVSDDPNDEVLVLKNREKIPECIVCAVPFLRDRDIRLAEPGESIEDKERKVIDGIREHYSKICNLAEKKRMESNSDIPIVVMGHLFTAGAQTVDGDGVRELYVGSLAHISASIFPEFIDYLALGHLHIPQVINGSEFMRYSGSPLPMGFGEAKHEKSVSVIDFTGKDAMVSLIKIPLFQQLESIRGSWCQIFDRISELTSKKSRAWLEVIYEGAEVISDLRERLEKEVSGTEMEILRIKNSRIIDKILNASHIEETLDDLSVNDVFDRCLDVHKVVQQQRPELLSAYNEVVKMILDGDSEVDTGKGKKNVK